MAMFFSGELAGCQVAHEQVDMTYALVCTF